VCYFERIEVMLPAVSSAKIILGLSRRSHCVGQAGRLWRVTVEEGVDVRGVDAGKRAGRQRREQMAVRPGRRPRLT
jgi:hypothetical protein